MRLGLRLRIEVALHLEMGQPVEPGRQIPVAVAEQHHHARQHYRTNYRGVDQQRYCDTESHLLKHDQVASGEPGEHDNDDQRSSGNYPSSRGDTPADRSGGICDLVETLPDAAE